MKKSLYIILGLMVSICMLSSCIDEYEADIPFEETDLLVVEGTICSSQTNTFILSRTQAINSSHTPKKVMGAKVSVRGTDGSEHVAQSIDGSYSTWIGFLDPDVAYYLHIEADGEIYESEPQKPLRTEEIAEVCGVQNTPDSHIDVLVTPKAPFNPDQANYYSWTYDETWEVHPDYTTNMYYDTETKRPGYSSLQFPKCGWKDAIGSTIIVGASSNYEGHQIQRLKMYDIDNSDERVYHRYSGLVHQRAITKAEYEYELARRQAGTEMGGLFTPLPSSLPTNIHCLTSSKHVIGFVGCAMNISEYRFFLDATDYSIQRPHKEDAREWIQNPSDDFCIFLLNKGMFLCEWTVDYVSGTLTTAWATEKQLDVRYKGAYIEQPEFWTWRE